MRARIVYHERLGDVIRCLPAAKHLYDKGYEVFFECKEQYHSLFDLVSYCKPIPPGHVMSQDLYLDLQIWPKRYEEYRVSAMKWMDFFYSNPEIKDADRRIRFVEFQPPPLEPPYLLVCPTGHSQVTKYHPQAIVNYARSLYPSLQDVKILSEGGEPGTIKTSTIPELIYLILMAKEVVTINSAPAIIANTIRTRYDHIYQPAYGGQDDTACEGKAAIIRDLTPLIQK